MKFKFACLALIGLSNLALAESGPVEKMRVSCAYMATIFTVPTSFESFVDLGESKNLMPTIVNNSFELRASLLSDGDKITASLSLKDPNQLSLSANQLQSEVRNVQIENVLSLMGVIGEDGSTIFCHAEMR